MPSIYLKESGFTYFQVPDRLIELRPQLTVFSFDLLLLLHCLMQHNRKRPGCVLLADDQIANHPSWGDRKISSKEVSRSRTELKKRSLLHYRSEGRSWMYFCTDPRTGRVIDQVEAARQAKELNAPKDAELAKVRAEADEAKAELAILKAQIIAKNQTISPSVVKHTRKHGFDPYEFEDTGQVDEDNITQ
ncbi:hypothetical protein [Tunturiibacter gelidoferens]|uniref:Ribosomal protein L29 n=1 Tax=Tunturiibacter gelidiferens TaxID=3069689 RepID=A0A9X0QJY1_9BACT|nr:hypothetical protein [Edaphobacter lichenicola]MBB5331796.1 ribosomal protein L29 [Edaphobacter lichenicola]